MFGLKEFHLRHSLHNEVHARPPLPLGSPMRISYLAMLSPRENTAAEQQALMALAGTAGAAPPDPGSNHYAAQIGDIEVKWERHAEFARYKFIQRGTGDEHFSASVFDKLPAGWLEKLPGEVLVATEVAIARGPLPYEFDDIVSRHFDGNTVVASLISGGQACAMTDFRIRPDGRSRLLVFDLGMRPRQAGRAVQRLLEIDTYRMMALLALPGAQALRPFLDQSERELADLTSQMASPTSADDQKLLARLTALEGAIQGRQADSHYRLSAATAYNEIVSRRIAELREERLGGFQTIREFMERRLVPAMNTCATVSRNAEQLSERIARCTALLSTRVGIAQEAQNRQLLQSMARRAKLQLRLQQTVEGLSIAAISYYIVGLVAYAAKALKAFGLPMSADAVVGLSLPVVIAVVFFGVKRIKQAIMP